MSEEKFWTIIENSNRGRKLKECLTPLSEEELFGCTTVRDSVFKLVCKVPNFAIKFELWIK